MTAERKAQISAQIARELANGKTLQQAFDAILGEGRYKQLAGEIYDALRKA